MPFRRLLLPAAALLAAAVLPGCAARGPSGVDGRESLRIGVKFDQPGIGMRLGDGHYEGFDVDVAAYVARALGATHVEYVGITSAQRESYIEDGRVDLVVASYSITQERHEKVDFAGPYIIGHQDIMVRRSDAKVRSVHDLRGDRLCQTSGSNSWKRVTVEFGIKARLVPAATYGECVRMLADGELDAVTTDDVILAGYAALQPDAFRIVNSKFTDEKYGIGLRKGDVDGCEAVNRAITRMYQDGTAGRLLARWFEPAGLRTTGYVPQFEGCG